MLAAFLAALRLMARPPSWFAGLTLLILGIIRLHLYQAFVLPGQESGPGHMISILTIEFTVTFAVTLLMVWLARAFAPTPASLAAVDWGRWTVLLVMVLLFVTFSGLAFGFANQTMFASMILPWFNIALQWSIFLPMVRLAALSRGQRELTLSALVERLHGRWIAWFGGYAVILVLIELGRSAAFASAPLSQSGLRLTVGLSFAVHTLATCLFSVAACTDASQGEDGVFD